MSAQFGRWHFAGQPLDPKSFEDVDRMLTPYGPDRSSVYRSGGMSILFRAFYTTPESRRENQPAAIRGGVVIGWDGRLDNRNELLCKLRTPHDATDIAIIASAYEQWGVACLKQLVGEWALSIWNPRTQSLILAKDHVGTRHLHYFLEKDQLSWCTILDPLVLLHGSRFDLDKEYVAGWLSSFPALELTPYSGIRSVPASCFVRVEKGALAVERYWTIDPHKRIRYRADRDYEEQFRSVFGEAVRRRLRSDTPILAELSGGMDSSSIVCMADALVSADGDRPRIDTVSYYDDSEPNWNERPYFTKVEEKRGRAGLHIDVRASASFGLEQESNQFIATPQAVRSRTRATEQLVVGMLKQKNRVVLSGIGGDEVAGGVPDPLPELADLLLEGSLGTLAKQLRAWALNARTPWFHLLAGALREVFAGMASSPPSSAIPWLAFPLATHSRVRGVSGRERLGRPSFGSNLRALEMLRRQLGCTVLSPIPLAEYRYPYLDRDLLEFLYSVPREQLVRPGQRRSLMRRALAGIVPDEILHRRRKAFVVRSPLNALISDIRATLSLSENMRTEAFGIVKSSAFARALRASQGSEDVPTLAIIRTLAAERWLRGMPTSIICAPRINNSLADSSHRAADVEKSLVRISDSAENTIHRKGGECT